VDLAALHDGAIAEHVGECLSDPLAAIDHAQQRLLDTQAA
jgi:hypothetical protein